MEDIQARLGLLTTSDPARLATTIWQQFNGRHSLRQDRRRTDSDDISEVSSTKHSFRRYERKVPGSTDPPISESARSHFSFEAAQSKQFIRHLASNLPGEGESGEQTRGSRTEATAHLVFLLLSKQEARRVSLTGT